MTESKRRHESERSKKEGHERRVKRKGESGRVERNETRGWRTHKERDKRDRKRNKGMRVINRETETA